MKFHSIGLVCLVSLTPWRSAGDVTPLAPISEVRASAVRAVELIDRTSPLFLEKRNCFACHSQTLSVLVLNKAMQLGIRVSQENLKKQRDRAYEALTASRVDTFGYALLALEVGNQTPNTQTTALVELLLKDGDPETVWKPTVNRPPAEASSFTSSYLALRGARRYGVEQQLERIKLRRAAVKKWIETDPPAVDTEDLVFRLRLIHELQLPSIVDYTKKLVAAQGAEGGWAQRPGMPPDAYATGTVLTTLREVGGLAVRDPAWQRGVRFLMKSQLADGSWHVATRAEPLQEYFETGFPHGKDQFISAFATGWAALSLLMSLEEQK